jgi:hypothetical protein
VRPRGLTRARAAWALPTFPLAGPWLAALVLGVLVTAAATRLLAPAGWRDPPTRALPNRPDVVAGILLNNIVVAVAPAYGAWLAARHRARGRRWIAAAVLALPAAVLVRAVAVIGFVGGLDPGWLVSAARWWTLELAALAVSTAAGWRVWRGPSWGEDAARRLRAVTVLILGLLLAGAVIEVWSA